MSWYVEPMEKLKEWYGQNHNLHTNNCARALIAIFFVRLVGHMTWCLHLLLRIIVFVRYPSTLPERSSVLRFLLFYHFLILNPYRYHYLSRFSLDIMSYGSLSIALSFLSIFGPSPVPSEHWHFSQWFPNESSLRAQQRRITGRSPVGSVKTRGHENLLFDFTPPNKRPPKFVCVFRKIVKLKNIRLYFVHTYFSLNFHVLNVLRKTKLGTFVILPKSIFEIHCFRRKHFWSPTEPIVYGMRHRSKILPGNRKHNFS